LECFITTALKKVNTISDDWQQYNAGHFVGVDEIKDGSQLKLKVKIDNYYLAIKFFLVNLYFKAVYFKQL